MVPDREFLYAYKNYMYLLTAESDFDTWVLSEVIRVMKHISEYSRNFENFPIAYMLKYTLWWIMQSPGYKESLKAGCSAFQCRL